MKLTHCLIFSTLVGLLFTSNDAAETYIVSSDSSCVGDYVHLDTRYECELAAFLLSFDEFEEVESEEFSSGCHV